VFVGHQEFPGEKIAGVSSHLENCQALWGGHLHITTKSILYPAPILFNNANLNRRALQCCVAEAGPWRHSPPCALKGKKVVASRLTRTRECITDFGRRQEATKSGPNKLIVNQRQRLVKLTSTDSRQGANTVEELLLNSPRYELQSIWLSGMSKSQLNSPA
jgi:hypothetical protein